MCSPKIVGAALAVLLGSSAADAAIVVLKADGSAAETSEVTIEPAPHVPGAWNITLSALYAPGGETTYVIRANGGEVLQNVIIDVPCLANGNGDCAPAGSPVYVEIRGDAPGGVGEIRNIVQTGDAETYLLHAEANLDIGAVSAHVIGKLVAGRDVIGPVVATIPDHPALGVFWVEAHRDIRGDVRADGGRLGRIWAWRDIGTAADPIDIVARHYVQSIYAGDGWCVQDWLDGAPTACAGNVYANVNTRNGADGYLYRMLAGTFDGTIETAEIHPDQATGAPGRIGILESFSGHITIGRAFDDPAQWIELPPQGLTGQITLNGDGLPGALWLSPIHLGRPGDPNRVTLVGPVYTQPAADLGGGSVGIAPFALHHASCDPPSGGTLETDDPADAVVRLRHYGPVAVDGPAPLFVERRPLASTAPWTAEPTWAFVATVDPADPNSVLVTRAPGQPGFAADFEYRIIPLSDLRSDVSGLPAVTWAGFYAFEITSGATTCVGDIDGNGVIGMVDLSELLNAWGPAPGHAGDLSGDGAINFTDLLMLLEVWGPCAQQG